MDKNEKIELHAVYRKNGAITICDQFGREFAGETETMLSTPNSIFIEFELEAPRYPSDPPRANVKISVPLEIEERLPEWMQEYLADRI